VRGYKYRMLVVKEIAAHFKFCIINLQNDLQIFQLTCKRIAVLKQERIQRKSDIRNDVDFGLISQRTIAMSILTSIHFQDC